MSLELLNLFFRELIEVVSHRFLSVLCGPNLLMDQLKLLLKPCLDLLKASIVLTDH